MNLRTLFVTPFSHPLGETLLALFVRVALAGPFFLSGRTKIVEGSWFTISDSAYSLFETEYSGVPLPPHFAAVAAASAEHLFPLLLVIGLFTRFAALGLIGMTMVIQIFVYPEAWWGVHMQWVALGLIILAMGPGKLSLDQLLFKGKPA